MDRKKIVIFSEDFPPNSGGVAQWAAGVAQSIHNMGHELRVLTRYRAEYPPNPNLYKFPILYMKGKRWRQLRSWYCYKHIKDIYRQGYKPDLIIATTWNFSRSVLKLARRNRTKIVTIVHGLEVTRKMSALKRKWLERTLRGNDLVVSVSHFTRQRIVQKYPINPKQVVVFPNGVDPTVFSPAPDAPILRERLGLADEKIVLTLARVVKRKGHDQVIRALPAVRKKIPNLKYIIAGNWNEKYYRELRQLVADQRLQDMVLFTGYVPPSEVKYFYQLCDVYVMPSRELRDKGDTEGFGITFLEANACEKPVIGGNSGGVGDAIVDGQTGFLVDPLNVDEIAEKLTLLLSDPELARRMGRQGRERIENEFTWDIISKKILNEVFHH